LYTSCVLGLRPFALFNEIITYQKKMENFIHPKNKAII
jgi:hypothetical protein